MGLNVAAVDAAERNWHVDLLVSKWYLKSSTCPPALSFGLEMEVLSALSLSLSPSLAFSACACVLDFDKYVYKHRIRSSRHHPQRPAMLKLYEDLCMHTYSYVRTCLCVASAATQR